MLNKFKSSIQNIRTVSFGERNLIMDDGVGRSETVQCVRAPLLPARVHINVVSLFVTDF